MKNELKKFRTIDGSERRAAMRAHLTKEHAITFDKSPFSLTFSERRALHDMAKAVSWRMSCTSPLTLGAAFYVYLGRDVQKPAHVEAMQVARPRQTIQFGKGARS